VERDALPVLRRFLPIRAFFCVEAERNWDPTFSTQPGAATAAERTLMPGGMVDRDARTLRSYVSALHSYVIQQTAIWHRAGA
jgi:hypothetical protein